MHIPRIMENNEENSFFNATKIFPRKPAKPTLARANHSILDPVITTCFCNHQQTLAQSYHKSINWQWSKLSMFVISSKLV